MEADLKLERYNSSTVFVRSAIICSYFGISEVTTSIGALHGGDHLNAHNSFNMPYFLMKMHIFVEIYNTYHLVHSKTKFFNGRKFCILYCIQYFPLKAVYNHPNGFILLVNG